MALLVGESKTHLQHLAFEQLKIILWYMNISKSDAVMLEKVQCKAAHFVKDDYHR